MLNINPFKINILSTFSLIVVSGEDVTQKYFWSFFSCRFTIATEDGLMSGFAGKYKEHSSFIVFRLST